MPSQFFGLYIAGSGLRASNAAMNTTANNIANVETEGYSRQQVIQEANHALRVFATYGCAGAGVDTLAIERIRNDFYDTRYWNNNNRLGEYDVKDYYMTAIEDYFKDDEDSGFKALYVLMEAALQDLAKSPGDSPAKATFISSMGAITDYFNHMYGNLQELQKDTNQEIKQTVDQINSISEKLAILNKQINVVEMSGGRANELRDQRDLLIDELSLLVECKVEEYPITDSNDPDRKTGGSRYIVTIAGGQVLTDGNECNKLSVRAKTSDEKTNQTDVDGLYEVYWENGNEFNLNNPLLGGKLRGLVDLRDGNNNSNFYGSVINVTRVTDPVTLKTNSVATISVTDMMLLDMNKCNLSDTGGKITIGNREYYYSSWDFNPVTGEYTFTMDDDKCDQILTGTQIGQDAKVGVAINYQGIPYLMSQMNEFVRSFSKAVNDIFSTGYDTYGNLACYFFSGKQPLGGQYTPADLTDNNGYYEITAGNFSIWNDLLRDPDLLGTRGNPGNGVEEGYKVEELISTLKDKNMFSFRNNTAGEFLETILADITLNTSDAKTFSKTYSGIALSIDNQRISISGVDQEEEAVNLVRFKHSFDLASKAIQILTEMYDRLILQTGV